MVDESLDLCYTIHVIKGSPQDREGVRGMEEAMKGFEKLLDRVVITECSWEDSPEHEYLLEDKAEGFFCIGTNGDPICCDSREEAEAEDYLDGIDEGCSWTLREFLTQECSWGDVKDIEDDDMFFDILSSRLGCGEVCWLRSLLA